VLVFVITSRSAHNGSASYGKFKQATVKIEHGSLPLMTRFKPATAKIENVP
jgi:hypothetical protein